MSTSGIPANAGRSDRKSQKLALMNSTRPTPTACTCPSDPGPRKLEVRSRKNRLFARPLRSIPWERPREDVGLVPPGVLAGAPVEERAELGRGRVVGVVPEERVACSPLGEEDAVAAVRVLGIWQVAVLQLAKR